MKKKKKCRPGTWERSCRKNRIKTIGALEMLKNIEIVVGGGSGKENTIN